MVQVAPASVDFKTLPPSPAIYPTVWVGKWTALRLLVTPDVTFVQVRPASVVRLIVPPFPTAHAESASENQIAFKF